MRRYLVTKINRIFVGAILIAAAFLVTSFGSQAHAGYEEGMYYSKRGYVSNYAAYEESIFVSYSQYQRDQCIYQIPVYTPYWQSEYTYQCGYVYTNYGFQENCVSRTWWFYTWQVKGYKTVTDYCN